jgi:hypothetical protein
LTRLPLPRVEGGRAIYGVRVGVLVLETRFPRVPGDPGNATTWPFPVIFEVIGGARPEAVVRELASKNELLEDFVASAHELEAAGVAIITTTAGFFALHQRDLQERLRATVVTSGLVQVPWLASLLPSGGRIGILTMEARSLSQAHLRGCGIGPDTPIAIQGLEEIGGYSNSVFVGNADSLDPVQAEAEHAEAGRRLVAEHPDVAAIVLQSNAMPPYAHAVAEATGRPVYDIVTAVEWVVAGHLREPFRGHV